MVSSLLNCLIGVKVKLMPVETSVKCFCFKSGRFPPRQALYQPIMKIACFARIHRSEPSAFKNRSWSACEKTSACFIDSPFVQLLQNLFKPGNLWNANGNRFTKIFNKKNSLYKLCLILKQKKSKKIKKFSNLTFFL